MAEAGVNGDRFESALSLSSRTLDLKYSSSSSRLMVLYFHLI